jgi:hypothetical protein
MGDRTKLRAVLPYEGLQIQLGQIVCPREVDSVEVGAGGHQPWHDHLRERILCLTPEHMSPA